MTPLQLRVALVVSFPSYVGHGVDRLNNGFRIYLTKKDTRFIVTLYPHQGDTVEMVIQNIKKMIS